MWRTLVQSYARQARELSDQVARLGQYDDVGPGLLEVLEEIKRRQALYQKSYDALERYVRERTGSGSASASASA